MESTSPITNVHHISGLDDRERGFNRQVQVIAQGGTYQARLRYEELQVAVESLPTEQEALQRLAQALQDRGYTQLRTQHIFQGEQYLGNQELWVDYQDPEPPEEPSVSWLQRIGNFFGIRP